MPHSGKDSRASAKPGKAKDLKMTDKKTVAEIWQSPMRPSTAARLARFTPTKPYFFYNCPFIQALLGCQERRSGMEALPIAIPPSIGLKSLSQLSCNPAETVGQMRCSVMGAQDSGGR